MDYGIIYNELVNYIEPEILHLNDKVELLQNKYEKCRDNDDIIEAIYYNNLHSINFAKLEVYNDIMEFIKARI